MSDIILTAYLTGRKDQQRDKYWKKNATPLKPLLKSIENIEVVILTDSFTVNDINARVVTVECKHNPYIQRWLSFYNYLLSRSDIDRVFMVDATDVIMLNNPFSEMNSSRIYLGEDNAKLNDKWMLTAHAEIARVFTSELPLLNAGVLGGHISRVLPLLNDFIKLFGIYGDKLGKTDMAAFNLLFYTKYYHQLSIGYPVTTPFNKDIKVEGAWFKHK